MGIFSRTRDIIAANFNDLLDKADDPEKMIRMIIFEMEETLVEVRASAARTIADQKEMHRHTVKLDRLQAEWGDKAQLALSKDREDLARAALVEKKKAADMADQLKAEITVLDDALRAYELDIEKLQNRLREARSRQTAIAARLESAENRVKLRTMYNGDKVREAFSRFDLLERRVDMAEGRADALGMAEDERKAYLQDMQRNDPQRAAWLEQRLTDARDDFARHGFCRSHGDLHREIESIAVPMSQPQDGELWVFAVSVPVFSPLYAKLETDLGPRLRTLVRSIETVVGAGVP